MNDLIGLSGTVLVTGGTRGIGRAISIRFAKAGATIIANYLRNQKTAHELKVLAEQEGLNIELCRADISTPQGIEKIRELVCAKGKLLSGLVFCAATGVHRPIRELTSRHFDWTFSLNARAFLELTRVLLDQFDRKASIVAISSMGSVRALPYYSVVGASKAALEALARHSAVELAPRGVRVNILMPGTIATDVWKVLPDAEERIAAAVRRTPIRRLVTADEVASAAQFLCSEAAAGIVGQTLVVDGGAGVLP
jgi:NAD(P)-dependent dehydrogenase (short-subunit alcohol dehydrogenase family)